MSREALTARVSGRVQGVSFRAWTCERAQSLGLTGWVRNEADGTVSAYFSGDPDRLQDMVLALHDGPRFARVDSVETTPADPGEAPDEFRIQF